MGKPATHLEIERFRSLKEPHANVGALASLALHAEDKVPRRVEDRFHLGPRCLVRCLREQLARVRVLRVSLFAKRPTSSLMSHRAPTSITRRRPFHRNFSTSQSLARYPSALLLGGTWYTMTSRATKSTDSISSVSVSMLSMGC